MSQAVVEILASISSRLSPGGGKADAGAGARAGADADASAAKGSVYPSVSQRPQPPLSSASSSEEGRLA